MYSAEATSVAGAGRRSFNMDVPPSLPHNPPVQREPRSALGVLSVLAALAIGTATAAVAASGAERDPELIGLLRGIIAAVPIAVGLGLWTRRPQERFGLLLAGTGCVL